jgi:hypothetical protein
MNMRWVAPPNWPPTPEGFTPPAGWQPDPSWPPPPPGWQFWQPAGIDVNAGRPWWKRLSPAQTGWIAGGAIVLVIIVAVIVAGMRHSSGRKLDTNRLNTAIETWMTRTLSSVNPVVNCPAGEPAKKGNEFLCAASDSTGKAHIDVTVLNSSGDVKWQLVG